MLSAAQKRFFYEEGYIKIPGAVPQIMVEAARHAMNHSIGSAGKQGEDLEKFRIASYGNELKNAPVLTDLFNKTPVVRVVEELLGEGHVQPCGGAQVALRFPGELGTEPGEPHGHLDGLGTGTNGTPKGEYVRGFTALAVVYLADVKEAYRGNFTVWPQSHRFFQEYFEQVGHGILAEGMPKVELPQGPVQMTGQAGDVILTHHLLVHTAAPNVGPDVRYAAIFRVRHTDIDSIGKQAYTDIWREWPWMVGTIAELQTA